ncbi:bacterio-opsin activator domain-containing protein [Natronolimnohabitans innermongolicus]|uniref:Putative PAS/PAC sensor protein n=1 Tax=Natronolimnohabitans innermongolicus JCM 12255 TaxID=1227499 RepID=L9WHG3_9EURY|nr:bacterio-opsin activator domain-containing protein [Natronolimnohabitans innermongolicus]ELY48884.1 putative PAS/PAC sensor protein [Natronolimnohabitans innermongolicus JCM 12255]
MSLQHRPETLVLVTTTHSSRLQRHLREETGFEVVTVSPESVGADSGDVRDDNNGGADGDERTGRADSPPVAVVELESPDRLRSVLDRLHAIDPTRPIVVAPPAGAGSETLAATAFRSGATEYIPSVPATERLDALIEVLESSRSGDGRRLASPSGTTGDYHRVLASELPDEGFVIGADGTYLEAKLRPDAAARYETTASEMTGQQLADVFPDDVAATLQACIDRTLQTEDVQSVEYEALTTEGRRRYEARVVPLDERIDGQRAVVWLARDITERVRRERKLRTRQDQLETLNQINTAVGQVIETLVEAPSRDTIEHEVCDQLVDSELYCGAWIVERTGEGTVSYRTGAGDAQRYLEAATDDETTHERLVQRAIETGEVQTVRSIPTNESFSEPVRAAARADDVGSAIAVPISHSDSIYGVLTVLAGREDAFSESERAGFSLLGETIGFTIMAVKSRQLLFADTVVELEFRIDGGDTFSFDLSESYDCTISLEWAGTTTSGRTVQYVTVTGIDSETVLSAAGEHSSIEECRLIHGGGDSCTIEIRLAESGVRTLANHGATIRDVTVEDGVGTCLIEVSQDANVREIAEALTVIYENTELVARREVDHPVRTAVERRNRILDQLTDRQLTTLRLAYYSGFFDWPRESTGEEIAEAMGVSAPTMHQHLRKGLKAVLNEFFDVGGGGADGD